MAMCTCSSESFFFKMIGALVFGAGHATYPGLPSYARPVELFVPSIAWGIVYLRYGLLPGMVLHFAFDLVLMSLPLFVADVPGIGIDRAIVVVTLLAPLLVIAVFTVVSVRLMKSRIDTIRESPNCLRRSKSLSSLTMKSDLAVAAHSRMRSSSGSSLMICRVSVGDT